MGDTKPVMVRALGGLCPDLRGIVPCAVLGAVG
jgi:hypothetical protein